MKSADLKRSGLTIVMALAAVNLWTGRPLLALWVGSRASDSMRPSMGPILLERIADERGRGEGLTTLDRVLVVTVTAGVLAFEVWFFLFSGSSLPAA